MYFNIFIYINISLYTILCKDLTAAELKVFEAIDAKAALDVGDFVDNDSENEER